MRGIIGSRTVRFGVENPESHTRPGVIKGFGLSGMRAAADGGNLARAAVDCAKLVANPTLAGPGQP